MAGIYSQGGSAGHRYAGWLSKVEAKNFQFGGKVFNGSPSAIYVGSKMVWMNGWLMPATKQAIKAAFGVDGTAVIAATNEYLNGIAASDKAKATALASYINEDPMMVCNLGLEPQGVTMPIRYIENSGAAYINTEIKLHSLSDSLYAKYIRNNTSGGYFVLSTDGTNYSNRNMHSGVYYWRTGYNINSNSAPESTAVSGQAPTGVVIESFVSKDSRYLKQDGVTKASNTGTYSNDFMTPNNLWIFNPSNGFNGRIIEVIVEGTHAMHWIPCKHNGVNGMYDIEGKVWKGNANSQGSFTIPDISYTPTP